MKNPTAHPVQEFIANRWSPYAYDPRREVSEEDLRSLFEAARWAPSCFNEQPWLFLYAAGETDRARFMPALVEKNQAWVKNASLLIYLLCRRNFSHNDQVNRHAPFDAGAAWMSLALQARKLGLYAHAMAGFNREKAYEILKVHAKEYDIMAAIAVGYRAEPGSLPELVAAAEKPSDRKIREEVARQGAF